MAALRVTQHRPSKDEKQKNKEIAELKRECHRLQRTVSRLQKENDRLRGAQGLVADPEPMSGESVADQILTALHQAEEKDQDTCSSCGSSEIRVLTMPTGTRLRCCSSCKHRERI